jgi:hypothetical protein
MQSVAANPYLNPDISLPDLFEESYDLEAYITRMLTWDTEDSKPRLSNWAKWPLYYIKFEQLKKVVAAILDRIKDMPLSCHEVQTAFISMHALDELRIESHSVGEVLKRDTFKDHLRRPDLKLIKGSNTHDTAC